MFSSCFGKDRSFKRSQNKRNEKPGSGDSVQDQTPIHFCRAPELEDSVRELERQLCKVKEECTKQKQSKKKMKERFQQKEMSLKESLADAQLKHQEALETISHLEEEKKKSVKTLQSKLQELDKELHHTRLQRDELQTEYEKQQESHRVLLVEYEDMKKEMKVSLADAKLKHQKALESISHLEKEKSELTKSVTTLQSTMQELTEKLDQTCIQRDELQTEYKKECEAHRALLEENGKIKKKLMHKEEVLKVSQADAKFKHQKDLESISQLKEEKSELIKSVTTLQSKLQKLDKELHDTRLQRDELQTVSLADAKLKHQEALQSISQLKEEKSELMKSVTTLQSKLQELDKELHQTRLQRDELQTEFKQQREAHSALLMDLNKKMKKKLMYQEEVLKEALESISQLEKEKSELMKSVTTLQSKVQELDEELYHTLLQRDELQTEYKKQHEVHRALLDENGKIKKKLMNKEEVLKVPLADAKLKHQKALEYISQLKEEKSELIKSVTTLQSKLQELDKELHHTRLQRDELHTVSLADAKLKHQEALQSISQLKEEKSELMKSVTTLQSKLQELDKELHQTRLQRDELQTEFKQQREAHSALLMDLNKKMKKKLMYQEEVLKEALESISQLEKEKSELMKSVTTLQSKVQELDEELYHTLLQRDELQTEYKKQHEVHRALLDENGKIKKKLMNKEEVLKVPLADAKLKHQKALEYISQLKEEKSELIKSVTTLQSKLQELDKELHHTRLQRDELHTEYKKEREAHRALLKENENMRQELKLKVRLGDDEMKHQKALETISQLEKEKSELTKLVKRLRSTVQTLGNQLCDAHDQIA